MWISVFAHLPIKIFQSKSGKIGFDDRRRVWIDLPTSYNRPEKRNLLFLNSKLLFVLQFWSRNSQFKIKNSIIFSSFSSWHLCRLLLFVIQEYANQLLFRCTEKILSFAQNKISLMLCILPDWKTWRTKETKILVRWDWVTMQMHYRLPDFKFRHLWKQEK